MKLNVIIGTPLVPPRELLAFNQEDWENNEKAQTLFTNTCFLPKVLVEAGVVKSISEVRRNKPELVVELNTLDCFWVKWGKKKIYIVVGELAELADAQV